MEPGGLDPAVLLLGPQSARLQMGIIVLSPCEFSEAWGGQTREKSSLVSSALVPAWGSGGGLPAALGTKASPGRSGGCPGPLPFFQMEKAEDLSRILPLPPQAPRVGEC